MKNWIICCLTLLTALGTIRAQDTLEVYSAEDSLRYYDPEVGAYIFPTEDAHVLGKISDEMKARAAEIVYLREMEQTWIKSDSISTEKERDYLEEVRALKTSLQILSADQKVLLDQRDNCSELLYSKDEDLKDVYKSRQIWKATAVSTIGAILSGGLIMIIKWAFSSL